VKLELPIRIVLVSPPANVLYGVQRGKGSDYDVAFAQLPRRGDVRFDFTISVSERPDGEPNFLGEYVQGPAQRRFIYVDVGRYAKQHDTEWARRMIIRLENLSWDVIKRATKAGKRLEARIQGTGDDGGPSCATVEPIGGWKIVND
jgi:hypothetical protein